MDFSLGENGAVADKVLVVCGGLDVQDAGDPAHHLLLEGGVALKERRNIQTVSHGSVSRESE